MGKEEVKVAFKLPEKKITIKPNYRNTGWVKNPKHAAFFKLEGTFDKLMVPQLRSGMLKDVLTKEEKEYLERVLDLEENGLSIYRKQNNFWHSFMVTLGKEPVTLDLSNPLDYIKYKVAIANSYVVAPSINALTSGAKFKYYIEDQSEVVKIQSEKASIFKRAWSAYGKMEDSKDKLRTFLIVFNETFTPVTKKIDPSAKLDFLQKEVSVIVEARTKDFVDVVEDPNYDIKVILSEGIQTGVLEKKGTKYYLAGSNDKLGDDLRTAIEFLRSPANQQTLLLIEERLKLHK